MTGASIQFGPFRYDPEQRALFRGGESVPLAPKLADLLHVLIEERGRIVDKAELMRRVWPETTVEEVGLARNVSLLRKALGDEADESAFIETVPRRGYRFVAPVESVVEPSAPAPPPPKRRSLWILLALAGALAATGLVVYWQFYAPGRYLPRGPGEFASIAVIPFAVIGPGPAEAGLARAFEESLVTELTRIKHVYVTSPGTVHRYYDLGIPVALMSRLLRLDAILEGSVQSNDGRPRLTVRLADVRSGKLIWAGAYSIDDGSAQADAASRIARSLSVYLQPIQ